jgi:hypothetical protein
MREGIGRVPGEGAAFGWSVKPLIARRSPLTILLQ